MLYIKKYRGKWFGGETTRVGGAKRLGAKKGGKTTRGETTRGETSWGRNVLLPKILADYIFEISSTDNSYCLDISCLSSSMETICMGNVKPFSFLEKYEVNNKINLSMSFCHQLNYVREW